MPFFSRKSRRKKKTVINKAGKQPSVGIVDSGAENEGYNPYDTMTGVPREKFGMRRQDGDKKWSF